ncbi:hypothetical protein CSW12_30925 (plasmid) [Bacillus cereus]|uniref:hypothetical protein n=1 Tax=Bacillus TaxID=1386 RepID=UPI000C2D198F|nr:hypothetical protein [Bacillus cereus]AUB67246.1 hypothetical protein CSW12_30925 [Bacillus cereus]
MKKRPEQYGWKLKKIEDGSFWKWYEAQDNINDSLIALVHFFTREYGIRDVKAFDIQEQMHRSLFLKDEFYHDLKMIKDLVTENKAYISNNSYDILEKKREVTSETASEINESQSSKMEVPHPNLNEHKPIEQEQNKQDNKKSGELKKENDIFDDVDQNSIF